MRKIMALAICAAVVVFAFTVAWAVTSGRTGLHRYGIREGVSRLASGYTHERTFWQSPLKIGQDSILTADSTGVWCPKRYGANTARPGRIGKLWRFSNFHSAQWQWTYRAHITAGYGDAVCTLFVFSGGIPGGVDSGKVGRPRLIAAGARVDTTFVPFLSYTGVANPLPYYSGKIPLNVDSILAAPRGTRAAPDSAQNISVWAVGDTF